VAEDENRPFTALIPGGGWMIYHSDAERGWSDPVVAWALCKNGDVIALEADSAGNVWEAAPAEGAEVWHPDSSSRQAQQRRQQHRNEIDAGGT
jgi:hypothetical protein